MSVYISNRKRYGGANQSISRPDNCHFTLPKIWRYFSEDDALDDDDDLQSI